jgi:hypothetical protein
MKPTWGFETLRLALRLIDLIAESAASTQT